MEVFSWRPLSSKPLWNLRKAFVAGRVPQKSTRPPCRRGNRWLALVLVPARWPHGGRGRKQGSWVVALLYSSFARIESALNDGAVVRVAQVAVSAQAGRDSPNLPQEARGVDLLGRVLEVHGQEASVFVVVEASQSGLQCDWREVFAVFTMPRARWPGYVGVWDALDPPTTLRMVAPVRLCAPGMSPMLRCGRSPDDPARCGRREG